uniref:CUB domain-containing protein n=1 Tax=Onchocerca volvulus TaxID=6282 RepID=A0A8R1TMU9_ONCVO
CGGHITNATSIIKYPDWTWYDFGRNKTCEWVITVNEPNKVIEINFTSFHLPTCATADANVTLRDGEHANSPLVDVPVSHPIYFSSNKAYLAFVSDNIGIGNFALKWRTFEKICQWHVCVNPEIYEITVEPMELATGDIQNCSINSLGLFDGFEINETERLLHLCSSESTAYITNFTVYFKIDVLIDFPKEHCETYSLCNRGFTIRYRSIKLGKDCVGTILRMLWLTGLNYFPNLDCLWLLDASDIASECLIFAFHFEDDESVAANGDDASNPIIGRYCSPAFEQKKR